MAAIIDNFGPFISARVRGMKSALLTQSDLDDLLEKSSIQPVIDFLLNTDYANELAESLTRYQGADAVEDAVTRNLIKHFSTLRGLSEGDYAKLVEIFVARWDLRAVKALLRNKHHGLDAETGAESLVPGPSLPVPLLTELANQDSMEALVRGLAAWNPHLCSPILEKLPDYQDSRNLRVLEEALDRTYFSKGIRLLTGRRDSDSKFMKSLLQMEVDRINLRLLFAPRGPETTADDLMAQLISRGTLGEKLLRDIAAAATTDRSLALLEGTPYAELAEGIAYLTETGRFSRLERQFELAFLEKLKRASLHNAIGVAILMRYAWLKYNEVMNLRLIARGIAVNMPKAVLREEVLYV